MKLEHAELVNNLVLTKVFAILLNFAFSFGNYMQALLRLRV